MRNRVVLLDQRTPALSLDFTFSSLDPRLTLTATSLATMYDSSGYITWRPNNILLNSATLSTQSVTTIASANYILSFKGTGSVALSGTATATLNGTGATDRVYTKFTPTAGTLTLTVTGTVTEAQLEAVTYETTPRTYNATTGSAYYGPRFDYNPEHGQSGALLALELSRSNTIPNSTDLSSVSWALGNATRTLSTVLGPDNITPAYYVTATADNAWISSYSSGGTSSVRWGSVFLRRKTGTGTIRIGAGSATNYTDCTNAPTNIWQRYQVPLFGTAGTYSVTSNVVTVTLTDHGYNTGDRVRSVPSSGTAAAFTSAGITVIDANTFTFAQTTANTSGNTTIYPNSFRIMVDTNGDEVYAWGAQFEIGGRGATSYIPTAGTVLTRALESITSDSTNFSSWFTQTGSLTCEFVQGAAFGTNASGTLLSIAAGTATGWAYLVNNSTGGTFQNISGSSGGIGVLSGGSLSNGVLYKAGVSVTPSTATVIAKMNGRSAVTNTAIVGIPTPDRLYLNLRGDSTSAGAFWFKSFKFYNRALTQAELESLVP